MTEKVCRRWPSALRRKANPYRARNRQPQIIDGGMQPKPAIFALSRACIARGTGSSNPPPSSAESGANHGAIVKTEIQHRFEHAQWMSDAAATRFDGALNAAA